MAHQRTPSYSGGSCLLALVSGWIGLVVSTTITPVTRGPARLPALAQYTIRRVDPRRKLRYVRGNAVPLTGGYLRVAPR